MNRRLKVLINGQQLGSLTDENNIWAFQYSPDWQQKRWPQWA